MTKRKLYQRLLILSVVGSITISSAMVAFADNVKVPNSAKVKVEGKLDGYRKSGNFKRDIQKSGMRKSNHLVEILATEVTAGVITQAEADKVIAFLEAKEATKKVEMDAQKAKLDAMTDAERKVAMDARKAEKVAERAKLEAMTVEERATYMKENRPNRGNIFAELVTAGILTQAKADKMQAAVPQEFEKGMGYGRP